MVADCWIIGSEGIYKEKKLEKFEFQQVFVIQIVLIDSAEFLNLPQINVEAASGCTSGVW